MLVKICGITRLEDAQAAVALGADAIGFVFWPASPRFIDPLRARSIGERLPRSVGRVGVFVNQSAAHINEAAKHAGLTRVQLHGDETPHAYADVEYPLIKAESLSSGQSAPSFDAWPADTIWLVDALDPVRRGGTGRLSDWAAAAALAQSRSIWLAGGLTPANIGSAIDQVRPAGVDVSSGVESSPGVKDHDQLRALFAAIRSATTSRTGDLK